MSVIAIGAVWKKANSTGAMVSLIVGLLLYLYLYILQVPNNPFIAGTITLGVAALVMMAVSYVSSETPTQALRTSSMTTERSD